MSSVALLSVCGSPGVTTTAVAMWERASVPAILVEVDIDGGCVAARHGLPIRPGLLEVLAGGDDADEDGEDVVSCAPWCFGSIIEPGWRGLVAAPTDAHLVTAALQEWDSSLCRVLERGTPGGIVIFDAGRFRLSSAVRAVVTAVDHRLVLVRPWAEDIAILATATHRLDEIGSWLPVVVGSGPYRPGEVAEALARPVEWIPTLRYGSVRRYGAAIDHLHDEIVDTTYGPVAS